MNENLQDLLSSLEGVLNAERQAIAQLDLASIGGLADRKQDLTDRLEVGLAEVEVFGDPRDRRALVRSLATIRRHAAINQVLLNDAQQMVARVQPRPEMSLTYDPRACSVRARAANGANPFAQVGGHD